ncbi:hypothetical protein LTR32_000668 [Rachicladosporium monterosium]|uniref:UNC-50 family protein n=1 Tax=Rachicladosporium monterosium TaxID=1507873 RepID=A0ABR0LFG6_9PEZI|nr:hypothetical protein LTR32_000668 [Rachicladosporium monterosium]
MPPQRRATMRVPPFFRRLFKFTSMDFETAVWEMTHLIIAPKKVFRNIYYHVYPAFTYLLALFCLLAGLAWGIAYAPNTLATLRITAVFVLVHFLGVSLLVATGMYFLVGRVLGRRRRQGLFGPPGDAVGDVGEEVLEFGYCFDVAIRAFLPIWTFLYLLQFLLLPLIARDYWVSNLFGNTMYLLALSYYFVITFLGYNGTFTSRILSMEDASSCEAENFVHSFALPEPNRAGRPGKHNEAHVYLVSDPTLSSTANPPVLLQYVTARKAKRSTTTKAAPQAAFYVATIVLGRLIMESDTYLTSTKVKKKSLLV